MSTPNEVYDCQVASRALHGLGQNAVSIATTNLLGRGVLSKLVKDSSRSLPGRSLKLSERYVTRK